MDEEHLIQEWIEQDPLKRPKADARLKEYGVAVWAIIAHLKRGEDCDEVAEAFDVPIEAVAAALAYYERNRERVDERIAMNAA